MAADDPERREEERGEVPTRGGAKERRGGREGVKRDERVYEVMVLMDRGSMDRL